MLCLGFLCFWGLLRFHHFGFGMGFGYGLGCCLGLCVGFWVGLVVRVCYGVGVMS